MLKRGGYLLRNMVFAAVISLASVPAFAEQQPIKTSSPEWFFGQRQAIQSIALSPDGEQVVFIAPGPGRDSRVYHVALADKKPKLITGTTGKPEQALWCDFVSNARIACRIFYINDDGGLLLTNRELIALDIDGEDIKPLGQKRSFYSTGRRQNDGFILDWLPESDKVLMAWNFVPESNVGSKINRTEAGLGVVELDTRTGRWKGRESAKRTATDYFSDGEGNIRVFGFEGTKNSGNSGSITNYSYRMKGSKSLHDLSTYDFMTRSGFTPLAVDGPKNVVFGLELYQGKLALFSITLDENKTKTLLFSHPDVDVANVKRFGQDGRVVGAIYADEYVRTEYFDKSLDTLADKLRAALPGNPSISYVDSSLDERKLLLYSGSDRDPGRYYLFDRDANKLSEIMLVRPQLEKTPLSEVKPVTYKAADGTDIPGYLTLPAGKEAKNLPVIIMPHGGPSSRDVWGFDWISQYLAFRGYAVLQPNFRGSYGYGQKWFEVNGFKNWDVAIGDVNAGAHWLIEQGIGDPEKMAIMGWSYGGYAALQSATTYPDLYSAVVAIAPVTDLETLIEDDRRYTSFALTRQQVGEGPHLQTGSPAQNADKILAPVLMFHGDKDINVNVRHARLMDDALKAAGKSSELVIYEGLDHQLPDGLARARMLRDINNFLDANVLKK